MYYLTPSKTTQCNNTLSPNFKPTSTEAIQQTTKPFKTQNNTMLWQG